MAHIDYYLSPFSPWCYLAGNRLEEIAARHGARITYKPLDILALFDRTGGVRPSAPHPNRAAYRLAEFKRWSAHLGMEMTLSPRNYPPNAAPAAYAIIAAQQDLAQQDLAQQDLEAGKGGDLGGLVQSILRAVWVEERDIADDEVLREKLAAHGFEPNLVTTGLFAGALAYERNLDAAVEAGVFGAPFYIVRESGEAFWGQDRLAFLDAHLGALA